MLMMMVGGAKLAQHGNLRFSPEHMQNSEHMQNTCTRSYITVLAHGALLDLRALLQSVQQRQRLLAVALLRFSHRFEFAAATGRAQHTYRLLQQHRRIPFDFGAGERRHLPRRWGSVWQEAAQRRGTTTPDHTHAAHQPAEGAEAGGAAGASRPA